MQKSGASGIMTAKGVKDCVVSYQCNDMVCFTVSVVGTTADVSNHICGNIPGLKKSDTVNNLHITRMQVFCSPMSNRQCYIFLVKTRF